MLAATGPTTRVATDSSLNANAGELSRLGQAVQIFEARLKRFKNLGNIPSDMQTEYNSLMKRANIVSNTIDAVLGGVETAKSWIGLGALPLIPIAIAAGAVAGVIAISDLLHDFMQRVDARRLVAANPNMSYSDAVEQSAQYKPSLFEGLGNKLLLGGLAIGALLLLSRRI